MNSRFVRHLLAACLWLFASTAGANLISNGDFETGDLSGWTTFTFDSGSHIGTIGTPAVVSFDTDGDLSSSNAARFRVGQDAAGPVGGGTPRVGGGIFQSFVSGAGILNLMVDVAASSSGNNADGGLFELLLNGLVVSTFDTSSIDAATTERGALTASQSVTAGVQEIRIRMSRGYGTGSSSPLQYVDDAVARLVAVPEPASLALLTLAIAGTLGGRRRSNAERGVGAPVPVSRGRVPA